MTTTRREPQVIRALDTVVRDLDLDVADLPWVGVRLYHGFLESV